MTNFLKKIMAPEEMSGSRSTKLMNKDPIWIRIQNTGFVA